MSDHKWSGPAFPTLPEHGFNRGEPGMDLRDYFAAKAMQSIISRMDSAEYNYTDAETVASDAYAFADAMLAARGK